MTHELSPAQVAEIVRQNRELKAEMARLTPKIETALLERMIADAGARMDEVGVNQMDAYLRLRLRDYLPEVTP